MTFIQSSINLFLANENSHMGQYQYAAHAGMRGRRSTSGAKLWSEAESARYAESGNMVYAEVDLLNKVANEIKRYMPCGLPVIELGPGTTTSFERKTYPIIRSIDSQECIMVDESAEFLKQIKKVNRKFPDLRISQVKDNFFKNISPYSNKQALVCSFGSTISNIIHPASNMLPQKAMVSSLSNMSCAANGGWFLIGFDSDDYGDRIKSYFNKHALFQLNIFDRMAVEFTIQGDFDPLSFDYKPVWIEESKQLAHMALASRNMEFILDNKKIVLKRGQYLHIKNSYKFSTDFFEECCKQAGLNIVHHWSSEALPVQIYLLKISRKRHHVDMNLQNNLAA